MIIKGKRKKILIRYFYHILITFFMGGNYHNEFYPMHHLGLKTLTGAFSIRRAMLFIPRCPFVCPGLSVRYEYKKIIKIKRWIREASVWTRVRVGPA